MRVRDESKVGGVKAGVGRGLEWLQEEEGSGNVVVKWNKRCHTPSSTIWSNQHSPQPLDPNSTFSTSNLTSICNP